jgi:hypothetical protein
MQQQTGTESTFEAYARPTRCAAFLANMGRVVPWSEPLIAKGRLHAW